MAPPRTPRARTSTTTSVIERWSEGTAVGDGRPAHHQAASGREVGVSPGGQAAITKFPRADAGAGCRPGMLSRRECLSGGYSVRIGAVEVGGELAGVHIFHRP